MKAYAHYIWDFDGTLFDSYPHSTAALYDTAKFWGVDVNLDELRAAIHVNFLAAFNLVGLSREQLKRFHALRESREFLPAVVPFSGAKETLEGLIARGSKHYLFTHSNRHMSVDYLKDFGMDHLFSDFITADFDFPHKPAPDGILHILKKHNIDPAAAVMVGDREIDILSGHNAGIDGILFDPEGWVKETSAEWRINMLSAIYE